MRTRLPFTGPAGATARVLAWGERLVGGGGAFLRSRVASRAMLVNCRPRLLRDFELLRPEMWSRSAGKSSEIG